MNHKDRTAVLYHNNCPDGFTAAYVAYKYFGKGNNLVDYTPVNYGDGIPTLDERTGSIYILDFSFSKEDMNKLYDEYDKNIIYKGNSTNITLLDHHKTAKENLDGWLGCTIDILESGTTLAWYHFFGYEAIMPNMFRYIKDRDLWQWVEYRSRDVSAYISSYDFSFETWELLERDIENNINHVVSNGSSINRVKNKEVSRLVNNNAHDTVINGHCIKAVNSALYQSEIGEKILEVYPETPFAGIYYHDSEHTNWNWSLRSRKDFDVSEVAKAYGGGGHAQAAGFRIKEGVC